MLQTSRAPPNIDHGGRGVAHNFVKQCVPIKKLQVQTGKEGGKFFFTPASTKLKGKRGVVGPKRSHRESKGDLGVTFRRKASL